MRLSVALCTFNGSAYLSEQLQSLARQNRVPDELVVFDDNSADDTVSVLRQFAAEARFQVKIQVNPRTLGAAQNFGQAIGACSGDIIALCDQDDLWMPEKLSLIEQEFKRQPGLSFVFSDANMSNETGGPLGYRLWESVRFSRALRRKLLRGRAFEVILRQNIVTGATMAFASRFRPLVLPIDPGWMHDGWLAILLAAVAPVRAIAQPLIFYRQHPQQVVGALQRTFYQQYLAAKKMDRDVFARLTAMYEAALKRLADVSAGSGCPAGVQVSPRTMKLMEQKVRHCRTRSAIRRHDCSRLLASTIEFLSFRYHRFSLGWKSFAQDLFLS